MTGYIPSDLVVCVGIVCVTFAVCFVYWMMGRS